MSTNTQIFGDSKRFAFEIQQGINPRKGCLRIWIEDTIIGDFKRQCEFIHAIYDFRKFFKTNRFLYEEIFEKMSPTEIYQYALAEKLVLSENKTDWEEAQRRQIYTRFFGDQFDHLCGFLSLVKGETLILIISIHGGVSNQVRRYDIKLRDYQIATDEFINWFNRNLASLYSSYKE